MMIMMGRWEVRDGARRRRGWGLEGSQGPALVV